MNPIWALGSIAGLVTFFIHLIIGGRLVARPLLAIEGLTRASRWLNYLCWHIVSVLLLIMALVLAFAAIGRISNDAVTLIAIIAASISVLSVSIALRGGVHPLRFPATYLLAIVSLLSVAGLIWPSNS